MESLGRSLSRAASRAGGGDDIFGKSASTVSQRQRINEDEEALRWAAIERLPTYDRVRTTIVKSFMETQTSKRIGVTGIQELDVRKMGLMERQAFIEQTFQVAEIDNEKLLSKLRRRIDRVGIKMPTVEVRFEHLTVNAECYVGNRAHPTLLNTFIGCAQGFLESFGVPIRKKANCTILHDATGIIKPSRMTLLLGPPGSGKTTLLLALAGRLDSELKMKGEVTYNGHKLEEFVPQKTSAYISQHDLHVGEMTVRETIDFAARCQGVGDRYDLLTELARREKLAGIFPDAEVDLFMKATAMEGVESNLQTDYTLKILGLDICADTIVGDHLNRGISGGQKKRVTTGEMIVGPTKTLFMDEISTGLDTSTTYQIVKCLQQFAHYMDATILMSLLQPAPETFDLFDDILFLSEGQIVYHGPRENVLEFFQSCGFKCPERKGVADFLQEVTSKKDQEQFWAGPSHSYRYVTVREFVTRFKKFHVGSCLESELSVPIDRSRSHPAALVFVRNPVPRKEIFKACFAKEWLLVKRNSFVYIFRTVQIVIVAFITSTVFLKTQLNHNTRAGANTYLGALFFSLVTNMFNGFAELAMTISRLPVFFKQRDLHFYPAWAFAIPTFILRIPTAVLEGGVWVLVTYYTIGFTPEASRFFGQFLIIFLIHQMSSSLFRFIGGVCRTMVASSTWGCLYLLVIFLLNGYIIPKGLIPKWWIWGYWTSPLMYAENAISVNEMLAPRWKISVENSTNLGVSALSDRQLYSRGYWFWIGVGALTGFALVFNVLFTFALSYFSAPGRPQPVISEEALKKMEIQDSGTELELLYAGASRSRRQRPSLAAADGNLLTLEDLMRTGSRPFSVEGSNESVKEVAPRIGMVLPFQPLAMSFDDVRYYVDMPPEMRAQGVAEDRLQLLRGVTGAFRPGVLTALMGVSGAGKTTLMDVLAGRKTGGYVEGDIRISGFEKKQETFARISGYCEQTDIHSPQLTVRESLLYSAYLRLPKDVDVEDKVAFVDQVMELVELDNLRDSLVGLPGVAGLSTEQRKRLTIAVELVANPSIIFMDEPTSGLDARAAAIVMRTVRNTVNTGRTVVCTIHQPSIEIFEAFDELLLMKRGGQVVYFGPLGQNSHKVVQYFEAIPGVPKIKDKYNPATWMLEVSSIAAEHKLGLDFADHYNNSSLFKSNKALVKELSNPPPGAQDLWFPTQYSQNFFGQFKYCLWKQWWSYWRSPDYNGVRIFYTFISALLIGTVFWKIGQKRDDNLQLITVAGAMYGAVLFLGINNCSTVQPVISIERTVFYRERAAGMYSALPYALAQVVIELPYVLFETIIYSFIVYGMMQFHWSAKKFLWFFYLSFITFLNFTYYGMMTVALTPNHHVAAIFAAAFYALFNLFSGFFIPKPSIPKWWIWYYYICPISWTVYGLITAQYGDMKDVIEVIGKGPQPISQFVEEYFGYQYDFLWSVGGILLGFAVFFAFMFAYCIKVLNFQTR